MVEPNCQLASNGHLEIGTNGFIGQGSVIVAVESVVIGADALVSSGAVIRDHDHGKGNPHRLAPLISAPVLIGENVWIGANVVVLKGVSIGDNAIVGAGAVVTRDVAPGAVAVGVPSRSL